MQGDGPGRQTRRGGTKGAWSIAGAWPCHNRTGLNGKMGRGAWPAQMGGCGQGEEGVV